MTLQDRAVSILYEMAPIDLESYADSATATERSALANELQAVAMAAVWRGTYLDSRFGAGYGDRGHARSVKAANKALTALRRALGFTYPERGAIHV